MRDHEPHEYDTEHERAKGALLWLTVIAVVVCMLAIAEKMGG